MKVLLESKEQEIKDHIQQYGNTGSIKPKKVIPAKEYNRIKKNVKRLGNRINYSKVSPAYKETLEDIRKEEQDKLKRYKPAKKKYKRPVSKDAMGHIAKGCLNTTK